MTLHTENTKAFLRQITRPVFSNKRAAHAFQVHRSINWTNPARITKCYRLAKNKIPFMRREWSDWASLLSWWASGACRMHAVGINKFSAISMATHTLCAPTHAQKRVQRHTWVVLCVCVAVANTKQELIIEPSSSFAGVNTKSDP